MAIKTTKIKPTSELAQGRFAKGYTSAEAGAIDRDNRTVRGVASTINLDRDGEIILPSAFARRIKAFAASNAPFLAAHVHRSMGGVPTQIGWVTDIKVAKTDVPATFRFAETDLGEQWWKLASDPDGRGIAFSVGFIPLESARASVMELVAEFPELDGVFDAAELAPTDRVRVYTEMELLEISAVPVPSNREAMQILSAKFAEAFGFGLDAERGDEALDKLAAGVADRVATKLSRQVGIDTDAVLTAYEDVKGGIRDLHEYLALTREELIATLPDSVNDCGADADDPPPTRDRSTGDAGGGRGGITTEEATAKIAEIIARLKQPATTDD